MSGEKLLFTDVKTLILNDSEVESIVVNEVDGRVVTTFFIYVGGTDKTPCGSVN